MGINYKYGIHVGLWFMTEPQMETKTEPGDLFMNQTSNNNKKKGGGKKAD